MEQQYKSQNVMVNILAVTHQMHSAQREHVPWILISYDCLYRYCLQIDCWPFFAHSSPSIDGKMIYVIFPQSGSGMAERPYLGKPQWTLVPAETQTGWSSIIILLFPHMSEPFSSVLLGTSRDLVISTVIESWMIMAWLFGENWSL